MDAKKLGQFIAEIRKEKEMTQAELASELHVTDKAVSKWERGLGLPDINSIEPLADALHELSLEPFIVSESNGKQVEEAAEMKKIYLGIAR